VIDAFGGENSFYVLYQYKRKGHVFLKLHHYDATSELIDSVVVKHYGVRFNTPFPLVQYSPNNQKILIYYVENNKHVESIAFDVKHLKQLWAYDFDLDPALGRKYLFQPMFSVT